ncbi:HAD-IIB family hydrolase [Alkalihalobacillus deserti]|uniref:HAD-IIB family hydrolase n=1 Tax=Alkalihalobacillus deserti TaxID=2879466 RepID=UPI001D15937B|nr:HAD-IIB family hydrolase [Alkalihalobacillus deserti]
MIPQKFRKRFARSENTKFIIFFDFDETYFPHECSKEQLKDLRQLENYLKKLSLKHSVKIGWVTGSDIHQILQKVEKANIAYAPHFIASNLGTEIYHVTDDGSIKEDSEWERLLKRTSYSTKVVKEIVRELSDLYNIKLVEQTQLGQRKYKQNYYYFKRSIPECTYHLNIIKQLCKVNKIGLNINVCNPNAGDPQGAFDVDFIPLKTGKKEIVKFMTNYYNVPLSHTIAFGDSGNDIKMLKYVHHGYLLANATTEAKNSHDKITETDYSQGILEILRRIFK